MTLLQAAVLGIVEGVTEFLPISSTGHLILAEKFLGIASTEAVKSFDVIIQSGAIAAAVIIYWKMLMKYKRLWVTVLAAFIPTGIIGLALHGIVKTYLLASPPLVVGSLAIGGVILIGFELWHRGKTFPTTDAKDISVVQAVLIGIAQSVALIPGTSRSAATVVGGMALGIDRAAIVDFSFMLAIPTMLAATGLDLVKSAGAFSAHDTLAIAIGFATAFITAYASINWLLRYVKDHTFVSFGIYRLILAAVCWMYLL